MVSEAPPTMTIDDLARAAGVVVSTVRLYQNRGLLPPPEKRGRVGYYDSSHLGRLRLIARLQERGFSLASIKEQVEGLDRGESLRAVLGLGDRPSTWAAEAPEEMPLSQLAGFLPEVEFTPELVARILELGLVELADDAGQVIVRHPTFLHVGRELMALGIPPDVVLDQYEELRVDARVIAGRFTDVFRHHLWEPVVRDGLPADRIAELVGSLEKLGPLAEAVVVMSLRNALQDLAEQLIATEAQRLGVEIPQPGGEPEPE